MTTFPQCETCGHEPLDYDEVPHDCEIEQAMSQIKPITIKPDFEGVEALAKELEPLCKRCDDNGFYPDATGEKMIACVHCWVEQDRDGEDA